MTTFLIDADIVAFKAATAAETPIEWEDGLWTLHGYASDAQFYCENYFADLRNKLGDGELRLYLSDTGNWRKSILPTYKANRTGARKPMLLPVIRDWMREKYNAKSLTGLEADDMLGIKATKDDGCIIVSEDKDLKTVPATVFNPAKDTEPRVISTYEADYHHMMQTLTGDATDGYTGCPTVGPKTAQKILADAENIDEMWAAVTAAYAKQKLSAEVATVQAQVARICRASDFNFQTKRVIPWTPPKL
jgi:5'-3' exonuclease